MKADDIQTILLLTAHLDTNDASKPLTANEWGRLAAWLHAHKHTPADLQQAELRAAWQDKNISSERLAALLQRGSTLAIQQEKWQRNGLGIITRADPAYPQRLKKQLGNQAPPFFHTIGALPLANHGGGIAIVGSRNAPVADLARTQEIARGIAAAELITISGGARGVDETAMLAALDAGGYVIGILPDSLLKASTNRKWRSALQNGQLLLLSPWHPEAEFSVAHAMTRNRYLYSLADSAIVIHSGNTGGTISGAQENLKHRWVSLWINRSDDPAAANGALVAQGGQWLPAVADYRALLGTTATQESLFPDSVPVENQAVATPSAAETADDITPLAAAPAKKTRKKTPAALPAPAETLTLPDLYHTFLAALPEAFTAAALTAALEPAGISKSQQQAWLKRALADGVLEKKTRARKTCYCRVATS